MSVCRSALLSSLFLAAVLLLAPPTPAEAGPGKPPEPHRWLTDVPQETRSAVRRALWSESLRVTKPRNDSGQRYTWFYSSEYVEPVGDQVHAWATILRCLPDRMVAERWRYTLAPAGADWEIVAREKVLENGDSFPFRFERPEQARPAGAFRFDHGRFHLEFDGGSGIVVRHGPGVTAILLAGQGRVRLEPPDDYSRVFFRREFDADTLDDEITGLEIFFHPADEDAWTGRLGWDAEALAGPGPGAGTGAQRRLLAAAVRRLGFRKEEDRWKPEAYPAPVLALYRGQTWIRVRTKHHRSVVYRDYPWRVQSVRAWHVLPGTGKRGTGEEWRLLFHDYDPALVGQPMRALERRIAFQLVEPTAWEGWFEVDRNERFDARVQVDLVARQDVDYLYFSVGDRTELHYVRDANGHELLAVPAGRRIFGRRFGRESYPVYRIVLPRALAQGDHLRLEISYSDPDLPVQLEQNLFGLRHGFLPFAGDAWAPVPVRFVVRSLERYRHVASGDLVEEHVKDGYRETTWATPRPIFSPMILVGELRDPLVVEHGNHRLLGYPLRDRLLRRRVALEAADLQAPLAQVARTLDTYERLLGLPCPWGTIRCVATSWRPGYYWPPTGMLWLGEGLASAGAKGAGGVGPVERYVDAMTHGLAHCWWGEQVRAPSAYHRWVIEAAAEVSAAFARQVLRPGQGYMQSLQRWRRAALDGDFFCSLLDAGVRAGEGDVLLYSRGPYVLHMLAQYYGYEKLQELLHVLATRFAGKVLSTADLQWTAEEITGEKLEWFFDSWVRQGGHPRVFYRLGEPHPAPDGNGWVVEVRLRQERVVRQFRNPPEFVYPHLLVPFRVVPREGKPYQVNAFLEEKEATATLRLKGKPRKIEINPNGLMYLETDRE